MKTRVLTVSKVFMKGHPRAGQETGFKQKILEGDKIHTMRDNILYWVPIIVEVMAGKSILSLREWSGDPYKSKQVEFARLSKDDGVGYDLVGIIKPLVMVNKSHGLVDASAILPANDGLTEEDFWGWFGDSRRNLILIHFNEFRY